MNPLLTIKHKSNFSTVRIILQRNQRSSQLNRLFGDNLNTHRRLSVLAVLRRANADNSLMDSSLNAVVLFNVKLRKLVVLECGGILDITEGGGVNNVSARKNRTQINLQIQKRQLRIYILTSQGIS